MFLRAIGPWNYLFNQAAPGPFMPMPAFDATPTS
jgi:hypothetical protein